MKGGTPASPCSPKLCPCKPRQGAPSFLRPFSAPPPKLAVFSSRRLLESLEHGTHRLECWLWGLVPGSDSLSPGRSRNPHF